LLTPRVPAPAAASPRCTPRSKNEIPTRIPGTSRPGERRSRPRHFRTFFVPCRPNAHDQPLSVIFQPNCDLERPGLAMEPFTSDTKHLAFSYLLHILPIFDRAGSAQAKQRFRRGGGFSRCPRSHALIVSNGILRPHKPFFQEGSRRLLSVFPPRTAEPVVTILSAQRSAATQSLRLLVHFPLGLTLFVFLRPSPVDGGDFPTVFRPFLPVFSTLIQG